MSTVADQKTILYLNRLIAASRERVFQAWTTPEEINLPSDEARESHRHGWSGSFDKLAKYLAH